MPFNILRAENSWRHDPVDDAWTLVTRNRRALEPLDVRSSLAELELQVGQQCIFCDEAVDPVLAQIGDDVRVVAVPSPTSLTFVEHDVPPTAPFMHQGALGAHELLVPLGDMSHESRLAALPEQAFEDLMVLFSRRHADLARDVRLQSVRLAILPTAACRLRHLHGVLFATPFPPPPARPHDTCQLCADAAQARTRARMLFEAEQVAAYVPYAPRSTFHIRCSVDHGSEISRLPPDEGVVRGWGRQIFKAVTLLDRLLPGAPIKVTFPDLPLRPMPPGPPHLRAEVEVAFDHDGELSSALGARITSLPPGEVARLLRALL